jgi:Tfp pilus assembly protein FimT
MEAMVGLLAGLLVAAIVLCVGRNAYNLYELNSSAGTIAAELQSARSQAQKRGVMVSVIFDAKSGKYGLDQNGNGKLENIEAEDMPEGVTMSDDAVVTFAKSGELAPGSKQPRIVISNAKNARSVTVSYLGSVEIKELD